MKGEMFLLNSCELTAGVTALANCIAKNLSDEELSLVSAVLVQLGDTLAVIAAHRNRCNEINQCK